MAIQWLASLACYKIYIWVLTKAKFDIFQTNCELSCSCRMFRTVLTHEKRHLQFTRLTLDEYAEPVLIPPKHFNKRKYMDLRYHLVVVSKKILDLRKGRTEEIIPYFLTTLLGSDELCASMNKLSTMVYLEISEWVRNCALMIQWYHDFPFAVLWKCETLRKNFKMQERDQKRHIFTVFMLRER